MDREDEAALDRLLDRASQSALTSLGTVIDVEHWLRDLHRLADPPGAAADRQPPDRPSDE